MNRLSIAAFPRNAESYFLRPVLMSLVVSATFLMVASCDEAEPAKKAKIAPPREQPPLRLTIKPDGRKSESCVTRLEYVARLTALKNTSIPPATKELWELAEIIPSDDTESLTELLALIPPGTEFGSRDAVISKLARKDPIALLKYALDGSNEELSEAVRAISVSGSPAGLQSASEFALSLLSSSSIREKFGDHLSDLLAATVKANPDLYLYATSNFLSNPDVKSTTPVLLQAAVEGLARQKGRLSEAVQLAASAPLGVSSALLFELGKKSGAASWRDVNGSFRALNLVDSSSAKLAFAKGFVTSWLAGDETGLTTSLESLPTAQRDLALAGYAALHLEVQPELAQQFAEKIVDFSLKELCLKPEK